VSSDRTLQQTGKPLEGSRDPADAFRLLGIYLNDHLGGSTVGVELARRCAKNNQGSELGRFLDECLAEILEDRETLLAITRRLGIKASKLKVGVGWLAEKAGRAKLNGRIASYSPLSRVVQLEGLTMGVTGKLSMWRLPARLAERDARLREFDFEALEERAEKQRAGLERHRLAAAGLAFSAVSSTRA